MRALATKSFHKSTQAAQTFKARRLGWKTLALVGFAMLFGACESKATADECKAACDNVEKIYFKIVDEERNKSEFLKMGAAGAELAAEASTAFVSYLSTQCEKNCTARTTKSGAECLVKAQSQADIDSCAAGK